MRYFLILSCFVIVSGCAANKNIGHDYKPESAAAESAKVFYQLIGRWYGEIETVTGSEKRWLKTLAPDGTFHMEFRITKTNGEMVITHEIGHWGYSGGIYYSIMRAIAGPEKEFEQADPRDPYYHGAYQVIKVTESEKHYKSLLTGTEYVNKRVGENFKW